MSGLTFIEVERNGFKYRLDTNVDNCIAAGILRPCGSWEGNTTNLFKKILKKGDVVVVDIGANIGYFTMLFSRLVGDSGEVVAFEPYPDYYRDLLWHIKENNLKNVLCLNFGLLDKDTSGLMRKGPASARLVLSLNERDKQSNPRMYSDIDMVVFDDWFEKSCLKKVDYVKIDVDGPEVEIISGMERMIKRFSPVFVCEFFDKRCVELGEKFWSLGYKIYDEVTNEEVDVKRLERLSEGPRSANFLIKSDRG